MIWWTKSWNPVIGCTKCSPACDNCYAERLHTQRHKAKTQQEHSGLPECYAQPFDKVRFLPERLEQPLHWRKPQRVFVGNMGDLFHEGVQDWQIDRIFAAMSLCRQHTFMLLTKRPERMAEYISGHELDFEDRAEILTELGNDDPSGLGPLKYNVTWPLPNVWLGTTIWDQASADRAVPLLLSTPAAKRFVSVEPMLGPVSIENYLGWRGTICPCCCGSGQDDLSTCTCCHGTGRYGLDWVICGGETGPGARPMHPDWVRSLRDQCNAAEVPFFFKQWGEWGPTHVNGYGPVWWSFESYQHYCNKAHTHMSKGDKLICPDGHVPTDGRKDGKSYPMYPTRRIGSRKAGRILDGRTWEEVPND